jgi:D-alanyl-D-alanine carboxypeptidase (penicillin-binding protein 5/6)
MTGLCARRAAGVGRVSSRVLVASVAASLLAGTMPGLAVASAATTTEAPTTTDAPPAGVAPSESASDAAGVAVARFGPGMGLGLGLSLSLGLGPGEPPTLPPNVGAWPALPAVTGASVVVIDRDSGTVLAARDADRLRSVASTVKMLTAVTARRLASSLDRVLVAGAEVRELEGSGVGLGEGEGWTVRQLLDAMLVRSGNDAAEALASQLVPGGRAAFLDEMRADAVRMGLDGAVLVSPSGLDDSNKLSAAHLATIALELLDDPVLAEIVSVDAVRLPGLGVVANRNELVRRDSSVIGVKTGFTEQAGHSLVAAADRDGRVTVVVVLDAASSDARFDDASRLLDHADSFVSLPSLAPVELGCPGRRVRLTPSATAVVVPLQSADLVELSWPPLTCPLAASLTVTPTLQRLPLVPVQIDVEITEPSPVTSADAALGRWLADLMQDAMRAVPPSQMLMYTAGAS